MHRERTLLSRSMLLLGTVLVALVLAALAFAGSSFSDPVGDNNSAPDVTALSLSESTDGILTVAVTVSNYQTLPLSSWVNVWFDLDLNRRTGDEGDEALVRFMDDGGILFFRWAGSELVRRPATGMAGSFTAGTLTLTVPKASLDNVPTFGVLGVGARGQDDGDGGELVAVDRAPNSGRARYVGPELLSITDPVGDHEAAPDIAEVEVSDTKAGMLSFVVSTPSHATLSPTTWVELDIDIDRRGRTGDGGVEAYVYFERGRVYAARWSREEQDFVQVRSSGLRVRNAGGLVVFDVPRRFLDDVASFDYYLISGESDPSGDEDYALDLAPDGDAWWRYTLVNKAALRLIAGAPSGTPVKPRAGRLFKITVPVTRSDTARGIESGSAACAVRIGGQNVKAEGRVVSGKALCSILVPQGASGRVIRGSITIRSSGKSIATRFSFRVK
ncbi:MAG TPA: hypothetical protein VFR38_07170 [Gaiellaceae bacterium]|nr:hypothetical protein [Gaiellaceae bacterium]